MKKLQKLQINSERLMNNEELVTLRGGYDDVRCYSEDPGQIPCFCDGILLVVKYLSRHVGTGVIINLKRQCLNKIRHCPYF